MGQEADECDAYSKNRYCPDGGEQDAGFFLAALPQHKTNESLRSRYPGLAGLAAQVEMFGLSKREIEKKFKRSELLILAWRSQEMSASFEKDSAGVREKAESIKTRRQRKTDGILPEGLPDHFFNEDGEVDLRQVTGKEAYEFMMKQGIKLPVIAGR